MKIRAISINKYNSINKIIESKNFKSTSNIQTEKNVFAEFERFSYTNNNYYYELPQKETKSKLQNKIPYIVGGVALLGASAICFGRIHKAKQSQVKNNVLQMKELYNQIIEEFPQDKDYYSTLAKEIGLKPNEEYKLASIVGSSQLEKLLKTYTKKDFKIGKNYEGIAHCTFRVSLHNHTKASDGTLSVKELLEQAVRWANRVESTIKKDSKPPFTIGITDHDSLSSAKEAVKIIAKNPEKYKNLRVVLGSEISVSHINPENVIKPVDFELIGYSLNPFNRKLNNLLNNLKNSRKSAIETLFQKINTRYLGYEINFEDCKNFHANLKNVKTNGVLYLAGDYAEFKIKLTDYISKINSEIIPENQKKLDVNEIFSRVGRNYYLSVNAGKDEDVTTFIKEKVLKPILVKRGLVSSVNIEKYEEIFNHDYSKLTNFIKNSVKEGLPTISDTKGYCLLAEDVFECISSKKEGFFGMAHPGMINLNSQNGDNISIARQLRLGRHNANKNLVFEVFNDLKQKGKDLFCAAEINYQSYKPTMGDDWLLFMKKDIADNPLLKLYYTGGTDTHAPSIFNKHTVVPNEIVKKYNLKNILGAKHENFTNIINTY